MLQYNWSFSVFTMLITALCAFEQTSVPAAMEHYKCFIINSYLLACGADGAECAENWNHKGTEY